MTTRVCAIIAVRQLINLVRVRLQAGVGPENSTVTEFICEQQQKYGFLEPMDWLTSGMGEQ